MTEGPQKPTLAVALTYEAPHAPRVVAVGRGATGQRIIDLAKLHGVPLSEDPMLAEALAQVELDTEIPEALYRTVAIVISYVLKANGRLAASAPPASGADEVGGATLEH
jgi:flagellar biosynthesis protein